MLSSIHPLGERARHNRWGVTATAYVIGSTVAGAAGGAAVGAVGTALRIVWPPPIAIVLGVAAAACLVGAGTDLRLTASRLPTIRRQVNEEWLNRYRGWVYGFGFGAQLGLGVVTIVTTAAVYVTALLAVLLGAAARHNVGIAWAALTGTAFGLARALPLLRGARVSDPETLRASHRRLAIHAHLVERLAAAGLTIVGVVLSGRALT